MLQPESVTIQQATKDGYHPFGSCLVTIHLFGGYEICGVCGELLLAGDAALVLARTYAHPTCVTDTCVPAEWKVARRVDAYNQTEPDTSTDEYWENQLLEFKNYQREAQPGKAKVRKNGVPEETEGGVLVPHTGQRWNGNILADCREAAAGMAGWYDTNKVSRLMVEIAERQIMAEERANLYITWTRPQLVKNAADNFGRPMFSNADERTSVGKDKLGLDTVPQDDVFTDEKEVETDDYGEAGFN